METLLLKRKVDEGEVPDHLVIFDDFFSGGITGTFYVVEQFGKIFRLTDIINCFKFPQKGGKHDIKLICFITGNSPHLAKQVQFYEDDTFEICDSTS